MGEVTALKMRPIIPQTMTEVHQLAQAIAKSGMAPRGMDTAEKITIAILHGLEIGLPPMQAVQKIAVINGRPTIPAEPALGIIRASGLLETINETIQGEGDDRTAICVMKRRGEPQPIIGKFSVKDAKKARLWDERETAKRYDRQKGGWADAPNDSPWFRFQERMLQMRARGFACRDGFGDVLGGLYLKEELEEPSKELPPDPNASEGLAFEGFKVKHIQSADPETGEISPPNPPDPTPKVEDGTLVPYPDEPFLDEIIEHGDKICKRGMRALQEWWESFSPDVRSAIGRNRLDLWKERAEHADESR